VKPETSDNRESFMQLQVEVVCRSPTHTCRPK